MALPPPGEATPGGEPLPLRAESPVQDHLRRDVRHLRQVRRTAADSPWQRLRHARDGVRGVRGHLRREERGGPPLRLQCGGAVFDRVVLPGDADAAEDGRGQGGEGAGGAQEEVRCEDGCRGGSGMRGGGGGTEGDRGEQRGTEEKGVGWDGAGRVFDVSVLIPRPQCVQKGPFWCVFVFGE